MKMRLSKSVLAELEKMNEKPRLNEAGFERRQVCGRNGRTRMIGIHEGGDGDQTLNGARLVEDQKELQVAATREHEISDRISTPTGVSDDRRN